MWFGFKGAPAPMGATTNQKRAFAGLNLGEKFGELEPLLAKPYSPAQHVAEDSPQGPPSREES